VIKLSSEARNLNWLVSNFVGGVPDVTQAAVVSSDGLLVAMSEGLERVAADRLSAVAAGLQSISRGAAAPLGGGAVHEVIVEMEHAILFVMSISETSALVVVASRPCDAGLIGYEMAVLVERCAAALTPALVAELQTSLPR
jgi:predicted regulator of Ras-like GTPase activity (Roadblock/LC7/MglB family)